MGFFWGVDQDDIAGAKKKRFYFCDMLKQKQRQKIFFQKVRHLVLIYTPKEAHGRISVTGGSFFARQMLAKKKASLGAASFNL